MTDKKITPGERAINWAKAIAIIVSAFGIGWASNTDVVKSFVKDDGSAPVEVIKSTTSSEKPMQSCPACPSLTCPKIDYTRFTCDLTEHINDLHK